MFTIGIFAQLTGLSVKALHHYDSIGLLMPQTTDPVTGYRYYAAEQARDAATISALRALGMGLPTIQAALNDGAAQAVEAFLDERAKQRDAEDAIARTVQDLLRGYAELPSTAVRTVPEQKIVSLRCTLSLTDGVEDSMNEAFAGLLQAVHDAGCEPLDYWWLSFMQADAGAVAMTWAIPVQSLPHADLPVDSGAGFSLTVGVDPEHEETFVRAAEAPSRHGDFVPASPELIALLAAGIDPQGEVRQIYRHQDGQILLELAVVNQL